MKLDPVKFKEHLARMRRDREMLPVVEAAVRGSRTELAQAVERFNTIERIDYR